VLIVGGNQLAAGGYEVDNSVRINRPSSDSMVGSNGTATDSKKYTASFWTKRGRLSNGSTLNIMEGYTGSSDTGTGTFFWRTTDALVIGGYNLNWRITNRRFRDVSAWYHIVFSVDTTQATADDRVKVYVNGIEETSFSTKNNPSLNSTTGLNNNSASLQLFRRVLFGVNDNHGDGYFSEFCFIDGQALDPTSFGEFDEDSGIWKPIDVSGLTFGTNGFYLPFENSAALGQDDSGNGNNFTLNNITSIDQTTDTPTNNYATMNSLIKFSAGSITYSNGNLDGSAGAFDMATSTTIGVNTGKWYWELKWTGNGGFDRPGIVPESYDPDLTAVAEGIAWNRLSTTGGMYMLNSLQSGSWGSAFSTGDIIMFALDCDNKKFYIGQNGTWRNSGDPTSGASGTGAVDYSSTSPLNSEFLFPSISKGNAGTTTWQYNFGNPTFTISSGNSDADGYGNFEYAVPSGYYALNTKNLAEYG
jgi:hypothetical protein